MTSYNLSGNLDEGEIADSQISRGVYCSTNFAFVEALGKTQINLFNGSALRPLLLELNGSQIFF